MAKVKVKVLNGQQLQFPDGHIETRSSHPIDGPDNDNMVWHAALAKFVPASKLETVFEDEVDQ